MTSPSSPPPASRAVERMDRILVAGAVLAAIGVTVPLVPWLWAADASLFGLPRSIVWIVALLTWVFTLLVVHYCVVGRLQSDRGE